MRKQEIVELARGLKETYKTNDPYELAGIFGIKVLEKDHSYKGFKAQAAFLRNSTYPGKADDFLAALYAAKVLLITLIFCDMHWYREILNRSMFPEKQYYHTDGISSMTQRNS